MITINAKVSVNGERKIELELPESLPSGNYDVLIVLSEVPVTPSKRKKARSKKEISAILEQFGQAPGHWKTDAQNYINQLRENDRF